MNNSERSAFIGGACFALFVMAITMAVAVNQERAMWQKQAIDHGAARYNATSGEFEWIEKTEVTE